MMSRLRPTLPVLVLALSLALGCAPASQPAAPPSPAVGAAVPAAPTAGAPAPPPAATRIRYAIQNNASDVIGWVADARGYFQQEGVQVEPRVGGDPRGLGRREAGLEESAATPLADVHGRSPGEPGRGRRPVSVHVLLVSPGRGGLTRAENRG